MPGFAAVPISLIGAVANVADFGRAREQIGGYRSRTVDQG
jgi:hypothetical protein